MRYRDIAFDLAALILSLDSLGSPDLADVLIEEYRTQSGNPIEEVLDFYLCFRAHDRALTLSRMATMPEVPLAEHQSLVKRAKRYYHLAHKYSRGDRQPIMLVMSGVIGVGKSRLASALSEILSIRHLTAGEDEEAFAMLDEGADPDEDENAARVDAAYPGTSRAGGTPSRTWTLGRPRRSLSQQHLPRSRSDDGAQAQRRIPRRRVRCRRRHPPGTSP